MAQENMTRKEKRMMEAARLRYMEDLNNQEIADRMGLAEQTIRHYFKEDNIKEFKRFYSDRELFRLQQQLEQDIKDGEDLANNLLARAIQHEDASARTLARASKLALENRKRKVELLQELGVLDKQSGNGNDGGAGDVTFVMEEIEDRSEVEGVEQEEEVVSG
jgi:DNA-binding transcriptional regulator LsrR (DeoR family)